MTTLSYGVGVQNRYSAFLDDEDGLGSSSRLINVTPSMTKSTASQIKLHTKNSGAEQKSSYQNSKTNKQTPNSAQTVSKIGGARSGASMVTNGTDGHSDQQQIKNRQQNDSRVHQNRIQHGASHANHQLAQKQPSTGSFNSRQANHDNKTVRNNYVNSNQKTNQSHQASHGNHENNLANNEGAASQGRNARHSGNFPSRNNYRRQFNNDDRKFGRNHNEDGQVTAAQSEDEKRIRQRKRDIDLKYKNPDKRDARRQQATDTADTAAVNQPVSNENIDIAKGDQRGRQQLSVQNNSSSQEGEKKPNRRFKPGRERKDQGNDEADSNRQQREGGNDRFADRKNRNGFSGPSFRGPRGSRISDEQRGFSGKQRETERPKPIPNFSDRLDFPSLVS